MIFNTVGNYLWIIHTFPIYHPVLGCCLFRILHPHFQCRKSKAAQSVNRVQMINIKTQYHFSSTHSSLLFLSSTAKTCVSLGVQTIELVVGWASLCMGVNSTLVRYFSCLNAPLFISHFLQTCYKSQLRTGKTDLHSKNRNFTKQTQNCTVKIYKHIHDILCGKFIWSSFRGGKGL